MSVPRDARIAPALEVRAVDGLTTTEIVVFEDADGNPICIEEIYQQTVVFLPEAFGLTAEEVEAAALIESAHIEEEA